MADARDLKSLGKKFPCRFESCPEHLISFAGLAATDCLLFGSEEALDDLRQHRLDDERVVSGVWHDGELVCGPQ